MSAGSCGTGSCALNNNTLSLGRQMADSTFSTDCEPKVTSKRESETASNIMRNMG